MGKSVYAEEKLSSPYPVQWEGTNMKTVSWASVEGADHYIYEVEHMGSNKTMEGPHVHSHRRSRLG